MTARRASALAQQAARDARGDDDGLRELVAIVGNGDAELPASPKDRDACGYLGVVMAEGIANGEGGAVPDRRIAVRLAEWRNKYPESAARWARVGEEPW